MGKAIQKLNKLANPLSFIQINTIKGFKYVDRAGEIVNSYCKGSAAPKFTMNLNGLIIDQPLDKTDQLKITTQTVWMKFNEVDSLDMVSNIFEKEAEKILNILDVDKISRVGWRNYFIYDFEDDKEKDCYFKKFSIIKNTKPQILRLEIETGKKFSASLMIEPVLNNDTKTDGVLFDVDLFIDGELERKDISRFLKEFRQYLCEEKGFLDLINDSFEKNVA
jgi:hypothetical protein